MQALRDNLARVRARIDAAALRCGRDPGDVRLVAVSKNHGAERVAALAGDGAIFAFGENRAREMLEKKALGAYGETPLHFIGHLQRNKVKRVVGEVQLIQSVGSEPLLGDIAARAEALGITQDILLEVNIGREPQKSGAAPEALDGLAALAAERAGVRVRGLMAIPPFDAAESETRKYFSEMYKLFVDITSKKYDNGAMDLLSMGMSGDFELAVAEGANMVRVGTGIFGPR